VVVVVPSRHCLTLLHSFVALSSPSLLACCCFCSCQRTTLLHSIAQRSTTARTTTRHNTAVATDIDRSARATMMEQTFEEQAVWREMWGGQVVVVVELARHEVAASERPDSVFVLAPRMGYLPLATRDAARYFEPFAPPPIDHNDAFWLDDNGAPLKWHFPTGVLYDLHARRSSDGISRSLALCNAKALCFVLSHAAAAACVVQQSLLPPMARRLMEICLGRLQRISATFLSSL
jgi:hypothetical protein